jgi:hypothetical protein
MELAICRHMKLGGGRCGSPAMRGQNYCYFHAGAHRSIPSVNLWPAPKPHTLRRPQAGLPNGARYDLPWQRCTLTGDALAIQVGLSSVAQGVMQGLLNVRQAKIFLSALHQAAARLRDHTATRDSAVTSNRVDRGLHWGRRSAPGLRDLGWLEPAFTSLFWGLESVSADGRVSPAKAGSYEYHRGGAALKRRSTQERGGD